MSSIFLYICIFIVVFAGKNGSFVVTSPYFYLELFCPILVRVIVITRMFLSSLYRFIYSPQFKTSTLFFKYTQNHNTTKKILGGFLSDEILGF